MASRIDSAVITLDVYHEFAGRNEVTFTVPILDQSDPLAVALRAAWQAHVERLRLAVGPVGIEGLL